MLVHIAKVRRSIGIGLLSLLALGGCISHPPVAPIQAPRHEDEPAISRAARTLQTLYPGNYRATHRAILTFGKREFTFDAVLHASEQEGHRLAVVSSFGTVTDLRIDRNGNCDILKVTPLFRESWARQYIARDLAVLFVQPEKCETAIRTADGRIVLEARLGSLIHFNESIQENATVGYVFDDTGSRLESIELKRNGRTAYRAVLSNYKTVKGWSTPVPTQFEIFGEKYRVHLRVVEMTVAGSGGEPRK